MKALIHNGRVVELCGKEFEVHPSMQWVDAPDQCALKWSYEGGVFSAPPADPVPTYQELRTAAYPSIADQLDTIYHEGIDAWKLTITAVKEEFPK